MEREEVSNGDVCRWWGSTRNWAAPYVGRRVGARGLAVEGAAGRNRGDLVYRDHAA